MTSLLDEPRDRRRRRTRSAVLAAAAALFASDGYRATSVDAIASRADIALTSLYGNFPEGKAQVYAMIACQLAQRHEDYMRTVLADSGGGSDATRAAFDEYVRFHRAEPMAFRTLGLADVADVDSEIVAQARTEIGTRLARVVDLVVEAIGGRRAAIRPAVLLAWAGINGVLALSNRGMVDEPTTVRLLADAVTLHVDNIAGVLDETR